MYGGAKIPEDSGQAEKTKGLCSESRGIPAAVAAAERKMSERTSLPPQPASQHAHMPPPPVEVGRPLASSGVHRRQMCVCVCIRKQMIHGRMERRTSWLPEE